MYPLHGHPPVGVYRITVTTAKHSGKPDLSPSELPCVCLPVGLSHSTEPLSTRLPASPREGLKEPKSRAGDHWDPGIPSTD